MGSNRLAFQDKRKVDCYSISAGHAINLYIGERMAFELSGKNSFDSMAFPAACNHHFDYGTNSIRISNYKNSQRQSGRSFERRMIIFTTDSNYYVETTCVRSFCLWLVLKK